MEQQLFKSRLQDTILLLLTYIILLETLSSFIFDVGNLKYRT